MTVPKQAVEAAGWEVEGFIDRLTRRDDSNSERLVLEAIRHLRAFSRDCDALREGNARLTQERDHAIENEQREREEHDELRAEQLQEIERLRLLVGVQRREKYERGSSDADTVYRKEDIQRLQVRERAARTIWDTGRHGDEPSWEEVTTWWRDEYLKKADAVLALLPAQSGLGVTRREDVARILLLLMQARYVLRDLHAKHPDCGYLKMADGCAAAHDAVLALPHAGQPVEGAVSIIDELLQPGALRLHMGEMKAQEARSVIAALELARYRIRALLSAAPASPQKREGEGCQKCERNFFDYVASGCPKIDCPMPRAVIADQRPEAK